MIIAIHQPNFLPWIGFFYKIAKCDAFVLLDNVQYTKNSFINRNKIKTPQGEKWLTVPVTIKERFGQLTKEVRIADNIDWKRKHMKTLEMNYKKAKYFNIIFPELCSIYTGHDWNNLCEFNIRLIQWVLENLRIDRKLVRASELEVEGKSTELLINIVNKLNGDVYLSGHGGSNYQDEEMFEKANIKLKYYEFEHPIYSHLWGAFVPNLSIIDLLFNHGPESLQIIMNAEQKSLQIEET